MKYLLQHLLISSAQKYPSKVAVKFGDETITYSELDVITDKLAQLLIDNGLNSGDRVGIYINKSIPSIISIYSILKAGGVYVPLDPQAPVNRISFIIDNCDIKYLLTSTSKVNSLIKIIEESKSLETVVFTDAQNQLADLPLNCISWEQLLREQHQGALDNVSIQNDLAYIIYTSGSTGDPKGVMISHLNSLTFVNWSASKLELNSDDVFSSHAPLHFDLSIFDIFVAAEVGGTLVLVPETMSMFPPRLAQWIAKNKISIWYSVPSILTMMVSHGQLDQQDFSALRKIVFAGEVFPTKYLRQLMQIIDGAEYINLYGPTETNVITYYITPPIPEDQTHPIPIGKCCENMEVFALSKSGKVITEPGEEGELLARGTCVAQGYWGDEEKTAKVFIRNPLQSNFYDKAYRTGDLVALDTEGNYIYKGRIDHMIKSRGYRIELGEIETAVYGSPHVKEVAVIAIPDDIITNRIRAVVVLDKNEALGAAEIRSFCSEKLPKYMIPEVIEFMEELPKTSTGKVDKNKLLTLALEK